MPRLRRHATASFAFAAMLTFCAGSALAQTKTQAPAPLATSLTGNARTAYEAGKLAYSAGDYQGAYAQFARAYEVSKDPRLLWNMAVCEKALRHYAAAHTLVDRYLKDGGALLNAESINSAKETEKALRAFYSVLTLNGLPAGARIFVDGKHIGTAPAEQSVALDIGSHKIKVEAEGFAPFEADVNAPGVTDVSLDVKLEAERAPGRIAITTGEEGAQIFIDGQSVGQGSWEGARPAGRHAIRVVAEGKKPYETTVDVESKGARSLNVTLEDAKSSKPLWPWIVGGVALAGGVTALTVVLLKPDDKPGSVPTGKLGTVQLPSAIRF